MEELTKIECNTLSNEKLASSGIRTIKNKTLLAPGVWNGRTYTADEIIKAYNSSDWNDKDVISLIADHNDDNTKGRPLSIRDWLGYVSNHSVNEAGVVMGDLNLCDSDLSTKLIEGEAKFGISPFVYGMYDGTYQKDFIFKNFAVVVEPACKECYVNLSSDGNNIDIAKLSTEERQEAKSNFIEVKGGKENMDENIENKPEEEKVEETVEEVKEEVVEEAAPEEKSEEEAPAEKAEEESKEEESEEKLLDKIADATSKLLKNKAVSPEQAKLSSMEKDIADLKAAVAKLQEAPTEEVKEEAEKSEEPKAKEDGEKMNARSRTMARTSAGTKDLMDFAEVLPQMVRKN